MQKVNILLVDDYNENLTALEAVLAPLSCNLIKATSGEEALRWVLKEEFALILLDVQIPGLDGFETARLIKSREKSKEIPIIFLTAINQAIEHVTEGYEVGGIDYIFKPFNPVTLRKKVEAFVNLHNMVNTIKEQSGLLSAISEASIDTILTVNDKGIILSVNPALKEVFDYTPQDILGEHASKILPEFFPPSDIFLNLLMLYTKEQQRIYESTGLDSKGRHFPVEISVGQAYTGKQQVFVLTIRDISERKSMEQERLEQYDRLEKLVEERTRQIRQAHENLRASERKFRKIFKLSPNMMSIRSLIDGRYVLVNDAWEKNTEYSSREVLNKNLYLFQFVEHTIDQNSLLEFLGKQPLRDERITYTTKSGRIRQGLMSTEIYELYGHKFLLSETNDITERLAIEQEMSRLDRLELIGQMAAGIAHEIRNPMTTVRGFLQMIGSRPKYKEENELFKLMIGELDRANTIITEFLALSKNGGLEVKFNNLNDVLKSIFPLIQADAFNSRKDVLLELGHIPDFPFDEREIRQLVLNLARNGLEAMSNNQTLTLRTFMKNRNIILEVEDQGSGIPQAILKKLGTPFFTTKESGTGLGLAICYRIAEKHHAKIKVNTGAKGTTFRISFPIEDSSLELVECKKAQGG